MDDAREMTHFRQANIRKNLVLRSRTLQAIRVFFQATGYLEVETPGRIPAPAPEAHIEAFRSECQYLQASPELCMKRLLAAGYPKIFQICKCFRKGERGRTHLPELTMLEWYTAGEDYLAMMQQTEALIGFVAKELELGHPLCYGENRIDLRPPWHRLTVAEAFARYASCTLQEALDRDRFDETIVMEIEPNLPVDKPVFLCDYPASLASLSRIKADAPEVAERFELYMGGLELCNAFSELRDPLEQRRRFEAENARREHSGFLSYPLPERFLACLPDLPDATGNALGVDRLVMLFADTRQIDNVVAFTPEEL